ncbi:MAG: hypothetical protein NZ528_15310 [Caldilineales bacterium]|nr:hypothetical protein [Caldilineales bacterium]MDW8316694.1 hypothetical protein [Anaerolineae bacterium]
MSSCIAEATLYGDLVKHLRDVCADQLAQLKGTTPEVERQALDEVIRAWFFTPQDRLYGYTPQRVIRNEQMNLANVVSPEWLPEIFGEDYEELMALTGDEEFDPAAAYDVDNHPGCAFGLAPDHTLLDEYDEEGYHQRWDYEEQKLEETLAKQRAEAKALPLVGADAPEIAKEVSRARRMLDNDLF